ncbi:hypothetical protein ABH906_004526 [Pseudomonas frederiksbergensis]
MIRHYNPSQKIDPTFFLRLAQLLDDQSTQTPISKKRLSLVNDSRYQVNTSGLGKAANAQTTSIRTERHSIASLPTKKEAWNLQRRRQTR